MVARLLAQIGPYAVTLAPEGPGCVTLLGPDAQEIARGDYILPMLAAAERLHQLESGK
jgi:hypothetical protein